MDKLKEMFELQLKLQKRLGTPLIGRQLVERNIDFENVTPIERELITKWHREFALALMMESSELMDWIAWKHWSKQLGNKQDVKPFTLHHRHEVAMEIVDCFHFLINIALLWGIDEEELFNIFSTKNEVNHARQDQGTY